MTRKTITSLYCPSFYERNLGILKCSHIERNEDIEYFCCEFRNLKYIRSRGKYIRELMREITKLTISFLYLIFLLSVMCVQGSNVTGTLFQLTSKVTTCADIYARLLTKPLSNPLLGSLSYSDTQETIPMNL